MGVSKWKSITLIPKEWQHPFIKWARMGLLQTRAKLTLQDRYDPDEMWDAQLEIVRSESSPTPDEWIARISTIPLIRIELEDHIIDPLIWRHVDYGFMHWETASFSSGRTPEDVKDNFFGIEFDAQEASRFGLVVNDSELAPLGETKKGGRKRSDGWRDWIAYAVIAAPDIVREEGPETLITKIAQMMAQDGLPEMPRTTVQPAAQAIIALLEKKRL